LSILGQHVIPRGGEAWTSTLVGALGAAGVEEKAARQALARSEAAGWLTSETEGRYTRWRVTGAGRGLVEGASARLARSLLDGDSTRSWDGRWLLVLVRVGEAVDTPAAARAQRQALQARLGFEGFGTLAPGLWVSADRNAERGARAALRDLGVSEQAAVFDATLTQPADIVADAWDLDAGAAAHEQFLARFADAPGDDGGPVRPVDAFVTAVRLGHEWQELLRQAPDLPDELLPPSWPGRRSRDRFVTLYGRLAPAAAEFYTALTDRELT